MTESGLVIRHLWTIVCGAIQLVRRDSGLYLSIVIYTLAGLVFLHAIGADDRTAYAIYFGRWTLLNCLILPAFAILIDLILIVRRFGPRRRLAAKRIFSMTRLAYAFSGLSLLMALMIF
ncbi:hypothetical protein EN751_36590, partial [Mesorhizobium sp. M4A.F.Ca.ET.029.04.2.1]